MVYTWTFTAATPSFRCRISLEDIYETEVSNDTLRRYIPSESQCREHQSTISVRECQRCYQSVNRSDHYDKNSEPLKACTSFIFDRTYYESTLVEEVSFHHKEKTSTCIINHYF